MKVLVNGNEHTLNDDSSLKDLLNYLNVKKEQVIIQLDDEILSSSTLKQTLLKNGSKIEIMAIVGGG